MAKKPSNLIYSVEENPPLGATLFLGLQHIFTMTAAFVFPVVIIKALGGTPQQAQSIVSYSMIAAGVGTILQALNKGPVGSGYLCAQHPGPSYLSASLLAAKTGGLSLLFGMTAIAGLFEALLSRVMHRLRALFPAEVAGFVVIMVGIALIPLGCSSFLGIDSSDPASEAPEIIVAFITLAAMIGFNVWGKGKLRLYCVLIGMGIGYLSAFAFGILTNLDINQVSQTPLISFPESGHVGWSFDLALLIPFLIASLASALKSVGDITTCQKINDAEWKRPDMKNISGGIFADALGAVTGGLLGGMGQSTASGSVGLSIATGATSRRIAFATGGILFFLAFFSKLSAILVIMPKPVMGALLIFVASFMMVVGMQIITSRMIDARKTFVIGISLILGLSVDILPKLYENIHPWLQPIFSSSLSIATVSVVILNLIFRMGISQRKTLELKPGVDSSDKIFNFMENQGSTWGARKEVIHRAILAMNEFFESVASLGLVKGKMKADVTFDDFNLDIDIRYDGMLMEFPTIRPTEADLLKDEKAVVKLSGFLIKQYVDRVKSELNDGHCRVQFHLEH